MHKANSLDVDEGIVSSLGLKEGERVRYELAQAVVVALPIINSIASVPVRRGTHV